MVTKLPSGLAEAFLHGTKVGKNAGKRFMRKQFIAGLYFEAGEWLAVHDDSTPGSVMHRLSWANFMLLHDIAFRLENV